MIKNFGENLKNLRKKMDLTQDEIAKILNVSTQTISRWETNMGYPDIEMLPIIANYYEVSVDSLFGLDIEKKNQRISDIVNQIYSYKNKGEITLCIELCRNSLNEFPDNFEIMQGLISCLYNHGETEEQIKNNNLEVIDLCETILKNCKEDSIRHYAIQILCYTYPMFEKRDKALELANKMPSYFATSDELITNVLEDNKKIQHIQGNLNLLIQLISNNIEQLFTLNKDYESKINILKSLVNIYKGFFDYEDYYFFHWRIHRIYRYIAAVYADNKKYEETIEYLEKAAYHALTYDNRPETYIYKSSIFFGFEDAIKNSVKNTTNNYSWVFLDKLNDDRYDFVRNDDRFLDIIKNLNQIAKD